MASSCSTSLPSTPAVIGDRLLLGTVPAAWTHAARQCPDVPVPARVDVGHVSDKLRQVGKELY